MRAPALLARRARAQLGALVMLGILVAAIAGICAGTIGSTRAAEVAGVRGSFAEAGPAGAGLRIQTRQGPDPAAQDAAARATLADLFPGIELDVVRSLRSEPLPVEVAGEDVRLVLGAEPDLTARARVAASGPADGEVLLPDAAAADLGLARDDVLDLGDDGVRVAGTWAPVDADDAAWFGELAAGADAGAVATGDASGGAAYGPVLTTESTLAALVDAPFVRWTVHPEPAALTRADLPALAAGAGRLEAALRTDEVAVRGVSVAGGLGTTAAAVDAATAAASAVGLVPVVLLAVIALVALAQVLRLLGQSRAQEVEILVARGAAPGTLTRWAGLEAAAVVVVGGAGGTALAAAAVARLDGGAGQLPAVLLTGVVVAACALAVALVVAGAQVRAAARRMVTDRSGRVRDAAAVGSVLLAAVAAVLATWQLRRFGTPLVVGSDGQAEVDVLAVAALAAVLTALAVVGVALLGPLARAGEALAARGRRLAVALAARQVSRRLRAYAVPVVLLSLAGGAVTTAGAFAGTAATQREQVAAVATGSDVRVALPPRPTSRLGFPAADPAAPYAQIDGVRAAASVLRQDATLGQTPVVLTALPTDRVGDVVRAPSGLGLTAAAARLAPADDDGRRRGAGIALPAGAATLELDVRVRAEVPSDVLEVAQRQAQTAAELMRSEGLAEEEIADFLAASASSRTEEHPLATAVWVADADGALSLLEAATLTAQPFAAGAADVGPQAREHTLTAELPGPGDHRVVAVEVVAEVGAVEYEIDYEVLAVRGSGAGGGGAATDAGTAPEGPPWEVVGALSAGLADPQPLGTLGVSARLSPAESGAGGRVLARLVPAAPGGPVPAVLTTALAEHASLAVGDEVPVALAGPEVDLEVVALIDAVPGGLEEHAVLVDQGALGQHLLRGRPNLPLPTEVWLAVDEPDAAGRVAAAAGAIAGGTAEVAGAGGVDSTGPVREAFWLAAAGSAVLALTGAAAVALALTRERRGEAAVLRALGQSPAGQARTRAGELVGVGVVGVLVGVAAGWLASWLLVPTLARAASTVSSPLALGLGLDAVPTALLLGATGAGLGAVGAVVAARVRAQARDAEYREEVR